MLDEINITKIALGVVAAHLSDKGVAHIFTEAILDSGGKDAILIKIILNEEASEALDGDSALDLLVKIRSKLGEHGENRFPIVEYLTEAEFADVSEDAGD